MQRYLLLFFLSIQGLFLHAQWSCGFDGMHAQLMSQDSQYALKIKALNQKIYELSKTDNSQSIRPNSNANYTLPVVVHLIVPPGTPLGQGNNLSDLQVAQGLDYLNQAFANQGLFKAANGVDVGIQFCFAKRDPHSQPTNGITRDESEIVNDTTCKKGTDAFYDKQLKAIDDWDCSQYINIWLVTNLFNAQFGCNLAGYAYYPGAPCGLDGIVFESRYWINPNSMAIMTHEMGHYLSLYHTFNDGCTNNNCLLDGDLVCDTPPDDSPNFAPCNTNSCNTDMPDLPDDNSNYMDYSSCGPKHFTDGQRIRMITALEINRSDLIHSKACLSLADYDAAIVDLNPGDLCNDSICAVLTIRNDGAKNFSSIFIGYSIDGNAQTGFMWNGNLNPNESVKISIPCFTIPIGSHSISVTLGRPDNQLDFFLGNNFINLKFETHSNMQVSVANVTPAHCASDGSIELFTQGGAAPFIYEISDHSYTQTLPFFPLLVSGIHTLTITDSNLCKRVVDVIVPDSCKINRYDSFYINRNAKALGNNCYVLTQAAMTQSGSVWYGQKADLNQSFEVYFDINLGCIDGNGADGMAFVLQPISTSLGVAGGGLGYQGISPSLDVEFDTFENAPYGDPPYDHLAIMRNGTVDHTSNNNLAGPVPILSNNDNVEDCNFHKGRIHWDAVKKTMEVYIDCVFRLAYTGDIVQTIFKGRPLVYFGFTASTGGVFNVQQVCFNYVTTSNKLADYTICEGDLIQVHASTKFDKYKWFPSIGINDTSITNPIFNPDTTTTYFLEQTDNCGFKYLDSFIIHVKKAAWSYNLSLNDSCGAFNGATLEILTNDADTSFTFSWDGKSFFKITSIHLSAPGIYTLFVKTGTCITSEIIKIGEYEHKLRDSIILIQAVNCTNFGKIAITALDGIPPYQYRINNGLWQNEGLFDNLPAGSYALEIKDQTSCGINKNIKVDQILTTIQLQTDSSWLKINCCNPNAFIHVNASGSIPIYFYSLDNSTWTANSLFSGLAIGKHKIRARDEFGCYSDTMDFEVIDHRITSIDTHRINICEGSSLQLGNNFYSTSGIYTAVLQNSYCCDSTTTTILFVDTILAEIKIDSFLCSNSNKGKLSLNPLQGIPEFTYALNEPVNFKNNNVFDQLPAGNYTLFIKDSLDCIQSFKTNIPYPIELKVDLSSEIKIKLGEKIIFNPVLNFIPTSIQWFPANGLSCSDCLHPQVQPFVNVQYEVIFKNEFGCEASAIIKIIVDQTVDLYIPNVFSPNGDQINDRLNVFGGESIQQVLLFRIYNRWGELIFENQNFQPNDLIAGWDGRVKGEKVNPGVYVYYLRAKRIDGTELIRMGDITLIK